MSIYVYVRFSLFQINFYYYPFISSLFFLIVLDTNRNKMTYKYLDTYICTCLNVIFITCLLIVLLI